jgi:CRISPR system Cascade subunit CasA
MRKFNLLDENWIIVLDKQGKMRELSLLDVFRYANDIVGLANELPTLDVAILRLLLAIMHSALARKIHDYSEGIRLWRELWENGLLFDRISKYLENWRERFCLFDDKYPFYQVAALDKGTEYAVPKLLGILSESGNKVRQFPQRSGKGKHIVTDSEAARWLLYVNAFDDTSAKPTKTEDGSKRLSVGAGWLGKLGLVYAVGNTLSETILLNFVLLDENGNPWGEGRPVWELDKPRDGERTPITHPKSQAELLTLQSRRLHLKCENASVTGYTLLGGDFFPKENAFCEQMTLWRKDKNDFVPKRHSTSKQLWRDFQSLTSYGSVDCHRPGVVKWLDELEANDVFIGGQIKLATAFIGFGDKDFFVDDTGSDSISFNAGMLANAGSVWVPRICEILRSTDDAVRAVGILATELVEATGDKRDKQEKPSPAMCGKRDAVKSEAYFRLDEPFRTWLADIDPKVDEIDVKLNEWCEISYKMLSKLGGELVAQMGTTAFIGIIPSKNSGRKPINSSIAYNKFMSTIHIILKKGGLTDDEQ